MSEEKYKFIEKWTEADLWNLPEKETDTYEYKSSLISDKDLKREIGNAASAFLNSGGGVFIAGVDDKTGKADGGITLNCGKQSRNDWVDQILAEMEPPGQYFTKVIHPESRSPLIKPGNIILVISFPRSHLAPHMSPDHRYYIRAGASTKPAGHFLVEAMRAYRGLVHPSIKATFRKSRNGSSDIELVILTLNQSPALNVSLSLDPLPSWYQKNNKTLNNEARFPLKIPVINNQSPFVMRFLRIDENLWRKAITLSLTYEDITGKIFNYQQKLDLERNLDTTMFTYTNEQELVNQTKEIAKELKETNRYFREMVEFIEELNSKELKIHRY